MKAKALVVGTTSHYSGKTLVCLGIGQQLINDNIDIAFFKPLGTLPVVINGVVTDEDAVFVTKALKLSEPMELVCPTSLTEQLIIDELESRIHGLEEKVLEAYHTLRKNKDLVLVGGMGSLIEGRFVHMSGLKLVELLDAKVVIVDRHDVTSYCMDNILHMKDQLGDRLAGVILNKVHSEKVGYLEKHLIPFLKRHSIDVLGVIPEDPILSAFTVGELDEMLGGEILCCEDRSENLVEKMSIGAMNVESAIRFFEQSKNKAVITGGDRLDIQLAALETSTQCLVLTGGIYPSDIIINRAKEANIPIMLLKTDTISAVEKFEANIGKLRIRSPRKVARATQITREKIDFKRLYRNIGIA